MIKTKFLISIMLTFLFALVNAQEKIDIEVDGNYYFKNDMDKSLLNNLKISGKDSVQLKNEQYNIRKYNTVKVIKIENGDVYFKYWNFEEDSLKKTFNENSSTGEKYTFLLPISDFQNLTSKRYDFVRGIKVGSYTVPIRLRSSGDTFEFESNLSLGTNIAVAIGPWSTKEHFYIDASFGISLTKVNLNEDNSSLGIEGTDLESISTLSSNAFTFSLGAVIHPAKNVNIGIFYGWDFLSGKDQKKLNWVHNKKPWIGLGINVAFTKSEANKSKAKGQKKEK